MRKFLTSFRPALCVDYTSSSHFLRVKSYQLTLCEVTALLVLSPDWQSGSDSRQRNTNRRQGPSQSSQ